MSRIKSFWVPVALALLAALMAMSATALAAFPGRDGKIAFNRAAPGGFTDQRLWTIDPSGAGESQLTFPPAGVNNSNAAWSPDGARLAYDHYSGGGSSIHLVTASGAGDTPVATLDPSGISTPTWSPDGSRIAFTDDQLPIAGQRELYTMNADGTDVTLVADANVRLGLSWSPDGTRIAFTGADDNIHVISIDGTGDTPVTTGGQDRRPDWSPDGTRIAFARLADIFVVNADGTGETNLTNTPGARENAPSWSPSGSQIAFQSDPDGPGGTDIYRMNADGSGVVQVTTNLGFAPAWQPLVDGGYARPKGATPLYASLVPAYRVCTAPNRTHAAPLAFESCSPPNQASGTLTVGTPDANSNAANFTGSARYRVLPGNLATPLDEADVGIDVSLTDVRCRVTNAACPDGPSSDYTGRLLLISPPIQVTDKDGQPATNGQGAATGQTNFPVPFDCTPTPLATIGSSCAVSTTADALVPNVVKEGHRAIWEMGPIHVRDAGPNGTGYGAGCPPACGDGDETLFLRGGVFVP